MVVFKLTLLSCIFVVATFISGPVGLLSQINANTPQHLISMRSLEINQPLTWSSNSTVPQDNITTVTPVAPFVTEPWDQIDDKMAIIDTETFWIHFIHIINIKIFKKLVM